MRITSGLLQHHGRTNLRYSQPIGPPTLLWTKRIYLNSARQPQAAQSSRSPGNLNRPSHNHKLLQTSLFHLALLGFPPLYPQCHGPPLQRSLHLSAIRLLSHLNRLNMCARSRVPLPGSAGQPLLQKRLTRPHCRLMRCPLIEGTLLHQYPPWGVIRN